MSNCDLASMNDWKRYVRIVFGSLAGATTITYFTCINCRVNPTNYLLVTTFSTLLWIALWLGNEGINGFFGARISWVKFPVKRLIVSFTATVVYTVSVVILLVFLWETFVKFSFDGYLGVVVPALVITFLISTFLHGRQFLLNWKKSELNAERLEKERVRAQYDSLRNQVNPHFLFNSLNALTNLVYEDPDKAAKFIKQLSEVYRYVLDSKDKEVVPLEDELAFLNSYLFLQRIRFGEKLNVEVKLDRADSSIAPLALQMLIENAIKHNEISFDNPLSIKVLNEDGFIVVKNKINKRSSLPEPSSGTGLDNISRRYEFLSTQKVQVISDHGEFIVKLPLLNLA